MKEKECCACGESLPLSDFYKASRSKDGYQPKCKSCHKLYRNQHYRDNKQKYIDKAASCRQRYTKEFVEYLKEQECTDCGNDDWRVLEFDHQRDKSFNIARKKGQRTLKSLMEEINKCEVVCANCHRIRTHKQFDYYARC